MPVINGNGKASPGGAEPSAKLGNAFLTDCWYVACTSRALRSGKIRSLTLLGRRVLLGRTSTGQAYALADRCPHRAVPLSAGCVRTDESGDGIVCPYHGWRFAPDGACLDVPAHADPDFQPDAIRIPSYPVAESQNLVWIWSGEGQPDKPPPKFPVVAGTVPLTVVQIEYPVHIDHAILGLVDPAHGPVVHRRWWWRSSVPRRRKTKEFIPSPLGFTMLAHRPSNSGRLYRLLGGAPLTEIVFRLPGLRWEHVRAGGRSILALSAMTPLAADRTMMTQIVWTDIPMARLLAPVVTHAARQFLKEDEGVLAAQSLNLNLEEEAPAFLWLGDADQQARWYLQLKREWIASRREGRTFENPVRPRSLTWLS